jgi:hypothetical protein
LLFDSPFPAPIVRHPRCLGASLPCCLKTASSPTLHHAPHYLAHVAIASSSCAVLICLIPASPFAGSVLKFVAQKPNSVKIRSKFTADRKSSPRIDQIDKFPGARCRSLASGVSPFPPFPPPYHPLRAGENAHLSRSRSRRRLSVSTRPALCPNLRRPRHNIIIPPFRPDICPDLHPGDTLTSLDHDLALDFLSRPPLCPNLRDAPPCSRLFS